jgi:hypothetical protein
MTDLTDTLVILCSHLLTFVNDYDMRLTEVAALNTKLYRGTLFVQKRVGTQLPPKKERFNNNLIT